MASPITVLDTIQGSGYLAIQAQMAAIQRHKLDLAKYQIQIIRAGTSEIIFLREQEKPIDEARVLGIRQSSGSELSSAELATLRSSFDRVQVLQTILGRSLQAIQVAMTVFGQRNPDLTLYRIQVVRDNDKLLVIFSDQDRKPGTRGYNPKRPGFEVVLDPGNLQVVRSYFVR